MGGRAPGRRRLDLHVHPAMSHWHCLRTHMHRNCTCFVWKITSFQAQMQCTFSQRSLHKNAPSYINSMSAPSGPSFPAPRASLENVTSLWSCCRLSHHSNKWFTHASGPPSQSDESVMARCLAVQTLCTHTARSLPMLFCHFWLVYLIFYWILWISNWFC